jgi:hypothetical protein
VVDKLPVVRFVGETPVVTLLYGSGGEPQDTVEPTHRTLFMPSPWRGWCWRCSCGARGSTRDYDAMLSAMGDHVRSA